MSESKDQKSWGARIGEGTDELSAKFVESISYDRRLYKHDIAGSIAHATMLAKVGLISDSERDQIIEGLKSIEKDIEAGTFVFDEKLEDIHMVIEDALIKRVGEAGKKLHTGRSRNDQVATDLMLWCQDEAENLRGQLYTLISAFVKAAERSSGVILPSFTHLQRAQPIEAGAECLAYASAFFRNCFRIMYLLNSDDSMVHQIYPLGSGAIAGSTLALDRRITQYMLPNLYLSDVVTSEEAPFDLRLQMSNSLEATSSRDIACDLLYVLAMTAQWLSRWAEQWIIYMTTEFSFLRIADRYTTSSSMMPQKRNPDMLELIRGRCGNVYGDLFALMTILKGLPIGYNRDLQEDKRIVFRAYDTVSSCLAMATAIVNSAEFIKENIEPTLDRGFLDATSLAEYLVTKGIPFRTAHHIVGTLVARCEKEGKYALGQLSVDAFNEVISTKSDVRVDQDVYTALGARNVVKRYQSAGAAGGKPFEEQLEAWKKRLGM